jgi:RHS repeat-associated protein
VLEIREDQIELFRAAVRAGLPDAILRELRAAGVDARAAKGAVALTDRRNFVTRIEFREDGAPEQLVLPSGERYRFDLDDAGRLTALSHSGGGRIELQRDEEGHIIGVSQPGTEGYGFSYQGERLAALRGPDGRERRFEYDADGRLTATVDRAGARTEYLRAEDGTLREVRDPLGRTTLYETEGGALSAIVHPDGTREEFGFDPNARVGVVTRRDGGRVKHELDHTGALSSVTWPDGRRVEVDVDEHQRLRAVHDADSTVRFEDDRKTIREKTADGIVRTHHDPEGRVTRLVTPQGDEVGYEYDEDGRLASVVDWEGRRHSFGYGPDGTVREIRYGNGLVEMQRYGSAARLECARVSDKERTVSEQRYRYDACARLTEIEDLERNHGWLRRLAYDAEDRLTSVVDSSVTALERFEYDAKGNMIRDGSLDLEVGPMDQPLRRGTQPIAYDANGNIVDLPGPFGSIRCVFGPDGTLRETRLGQHTVRYEYDALGRRVLKTDGVRSWHYGWHGHQLLWEDYQEAPGARGVRRDYLWSPDGFVPLAFREGGRTYWIQCDARGAPIRVFRQDRSVVWSARYDSFGGATVDVEHVRQPWRLMGQYHDDETGLHHSHCRYYSPHIKSYLSRDPLWYEPGAANYSYAKNSPYTYADPFGGPFFLLAAVAAVAIGAVVGAVIAAATGGDPIAGAVEGAVGVAGAIVGGIVGGMIGGPVGMVAGGMAGSALGAAAGSLTENLRRGEPLCVPCALKAAGVALAVDVALLGLGKIPGVRQVARRLGNKLASKGQALKRWAQRTFDRSRVGYGGTRKIQKRLRDGTVEEVEIPGHVGEREPLEPQPGRRGEVHGQQTNNSCGIACSRMLIQDKTLVDTPEWMLREQAHDMGVYLPDGGAKPHRLHELLEANGVSADQMRSASFDDLARNTGGDRKAIAKVWSPGGDHVIVVDRIERLPDGRSIVYKRDPGKWGGGSTPMWGDAFKETYQGEAIFANVR